LAVRNRLRRPLKRLWERKGGLAEGNAQKNKLPHKRKDYDHGQKEDWAALDGGEGSNVKNIKDGTNAKKIRGEYLQGEEQEALSSSVYCWLTHSHRRGSGKGVTETESLSAGKGGEIRETPSNRFTTFEHKLTERTPLGAGTSSQDWMDGVSSALGRGNMSFWGRAVTKKNRSRANSRSLKEGCKVLFRLILIGEISCLLERLQ